MAKPETRECAHCGEQSVPVRAKARGASKTTVVCAICRAPWTPKHA